MLGQGTFGGKRFFMPFSLASHGPRIALPFSCFENAALSLQNLYLALRGVQMSYMLTFRWSKT